jgi:pimeloyl-ACP methyl ester carboxylesterase
MSDLIADAYPRQAAATLSWDNLAEDSWMCGAGGNKALRLKSVQIPLLTDRDDSGRLLRAARDAGFERFHLVGYSGGGASSLAFAARRPESLLSLALIEPAWLGTKALVPRSRVYDESSSRSRRCRPSR